MNLTSEQIQAIRQGEPVRLVLPEIGEECVVLRAADFEGTAHALKGLDPTQAYPAIDEALKDDWEFPGMEDYDQNVPLAFRRLESPREPDEAPFAKCLRKLM